MAINLSVNTIIPENLNAKWFFLYILSFSLVYMRGENNAFNHNDTEIFAITPHNII